jgi:hypothetical protein
MFYHKDLNRHKAVSLLKPMQKDLIKGAVIPSITDESQPTGDSTNVPEMRLAKKLKNYGFPAFDPQHEIKLPGSIGLTIPDFYYESSDSSIRVAIYLDGLSKAIHGSEQQQQKDNYIRTVLRSQGVYVEAIPATALDDPMSLRYHLMAIAHALKHKELISKVEKE